jgi:hypothetical protein
MAGLTEVRGRSDSSRLKGAHEALGEGVADAGGAEVDDGAASGLLDHAHGGAEGGAGGRVAGAGVLVIEDVAKEVAAMDADQCGLGGLDADTLRVDGADAADGERQVRELVDG